MKPLRNPWPWGIGLFLVGFLLSMVAFVIWSLGHRQDLVVQDYYERDLVYQQTIDSFARAHAGGIAPLRYDAENKTLVAELPADATGIELALYRPSDAKLDELRTLEPASGAPIISDVKKLAPGLWRATLEWTQNEESYRIALAFILE